MHTNPLIADLRSLSRLLDAALEAGAASFEPWLAALPPQDQHLVPRLREMLAGHWCGTPSTPLATFPKLEDGAEEPADRPGDVVGPYRLLREIGRGGMSCVWLARAIDGSGEDVALKLSRIAQGGSQAQRIALECSIAALMHHPNVVRLLDTGLDAAEQPYLVLEYIKGQSMRDWCGTRRLDALGIASLFLQLAGAVAYVHSRGVVHRDLKPSNVLVCDAGQVHLIDFGISIEQVKPNAVSLNAKDQRGMTPGYASPEQLAGCATSFASDVYSLGVLFCELLAAPLARMTPGDAKAGGVNDHAGPSADSRLASLAQAAAAGQMPRALASILQTALEPSPQRRYQTAQELADAMAKFVGASASIAAEVQRFDRIRRSSVRLCKFTASVGV
jgi:serine/threonine protein kinase